jgi:hypothetical protein
MMTSTENTHEYEIHVRGLKLLYTSVVDVEDLILSEKNNQCEEKSPIVRGMAMF